MFSNIHVYLRDTKNNEKSCIALRDIEEKDSEYAGLIFKHLLVIINYLMSHI